MCSMPRLRPRPRPEAHSVALAFFHAFFFQCLSCIISKGTKGGKRIVEQKIVACPLKSGVHGMLVVVLPCLPLPPYSYTHFNSGTMTRNTLSLKYSKQVLFTIGCLAPKAGVCHIFFKESLLCKSEGLSWTCTLANQGPHLDISLARYTFLYNESLFPPQGIWLLQVITQDGILVSSTSVNNITEGIPLTGTCICFV